jgi:hypothetical protein
VQQPRSRLPRRLEKSAKPEPALCGKNSETRQIWLKERSFGSQQRI